jgi:hypothetical protein
VKNPKELVELSVTMGSLNTAGFSVPMVQAFARSPWLAWLRQSPSRPNSRYMLEHIARLKALQALDLPAGLERQVHQNRLLKIAREGSQMTPADLGNPGLTKIDPV